MALQAAGGFATFGITDGAQIRDISDVLADAIYYDLHLLGNINVDFGSPVYDVVHYWNEDALNSDTFVNSGAATSTTTTITTATGHGARVHVGDLIYRTSTAASTEVIQVTAVSTDTLTITRGYDSTTAQTLVDLDTMAIIRAEQEGSDIGSDKTLTPTVRSNDTQIFAGAYDIKITGSQLARKMATVQMQDFLARQLSNRAIELKIGLSRAALYSEISSSSGSASVYRTMSGIRAWNRNGSGVTNSVSTALAYSGSNSLATVNKSVVDKGVFPDLLVIGTDLVGSLTGFDSSNRRLLESDRVAGYTLQEVLLQQGNSVRVVVDSRVSTGDAFLLSSERIKLVPMNGRGMFVISAVDFTDAKKRRVLAEWTMEVRNPEASCYISAKT
jgi:hypothetical protein